MMLSKTGIKTKTMQVTWPLQEKWLVVVGVEE